MAKGKGLLLLLFGAMMLGGDKKAEAKLPEPDDVPPGEVPPGEVPPGEVPPGDVDIPVVQVVFVPGEEPPVTPTPDIGPIFPGPEQPIPVAPTVAPIQIYNSLIKPTPQTNAGYCIKPGETLLGPNGICAQALKNTTGQTPTSEERYAYFEAVTRVRTNWLLYAGESVNNPVEVTDETGATVDGSITSAFFKMHDSWPASLNEDELPARLVAWARNQNLQPIPVGGWQNIAHGPAKTTRKLGCLWLPDAGCVNFGPDVFTNALCDWPPDLWDALGIGRMEWMPA